MTDNGIFRKSDMDGMTFGKRLRKLRTDAELTQEELAAKSGMTRSSIAKFERDEREPLLTTANRLAKALGVDCTAFQDDQAEPKKPAKPKRKKGKGA
jgi:transcriptional regulator with XRE-family HTH domain